MDGNSDSTCAPRCVIPNILVVFVDECASEDHRAPVV